MAGLPSGTVTFLLTDLEGSTRAWESMPEAMRAAMARHDRILNDLAARHGGMQVEAGREGDSVLVAFKTAAEGAACALDIQRGFASEPWPEGLSMNVRIALHTGEAQLREGHYFGPALNRCARLLATCNPGQTLLTKATEAMLADSLPERASLRDLGLHRLKDLTRLEQVFQLSDDARPADFPPIRSLPRQVDNLPHELTTFVGREDELGQLRDLQSRGRLLTLIGPGGVGKTRLAIQLASELRGQFGDGVWLVELAAIDDPALVPQAVAGALGVPEQAHKRLLETLADHLRERESLLLLDNCEHVIEAAARLAEILLRSCSGLSVLVTSREALNVSGEMVWWVPPLSDSEAIGLFIDRAPALDPARAQAATAVIGDICRRLDGLPLAIELAAARVHMMPVEEIAARLGDRFRLLTGGSRTAAGRQRTLEAAVDWSYDQLPEPERTLFTRLAVFAGRFTLEDVEAICSSPPLDRSLVLELLGRLVDKSLLLVEEGSYRSLETIREYALRHLAESGGEQQVRRLHADRFLAVAESREPGGLAGWLDRLEDAHDNSRAALGWALGHDEELGLRLARALDEFWQLRGHNTEARGSLEALVARGGDSPLQPGVRVQLATFAYVQDDLDAAEREIENALDVARRRGARDVEMSAHKIRALVALARGDQDLAERSAEAALALAVAAGDRLQEGQLLHHLGLIRASAGDVDGALDRLERSIAIREELGRGDEVGTTLAFLAAIRNLSGDAAGADAAIVESLRVGSRLDDRRLGWTLDILATRLAPERPVEAIRLAGAASAMHDSIGIRPSAIWQSLLEAALAPARQALGEAASGRAWAQGRRLNLAEAVAEALHQAGAPADVLLSAES